MDIDIDMDMCPPCVETLPLRSRNMSASEGTVVASFDPATDEGGQPADNCS
jgi:hypothetical protein